MGSVILGDWTHRRGDAGGTRSVPAEMAHPRPAIAWAWQPEHGGRVDQVRVAGTVVVVATMMPRDPHAPGWEHAVVYVLDARTGIEIARRLLPDPVPVAAMAVDAGLVHVVATRKTEPIFWYALTLAELAPRHRKIVSSSQPTRHEDVLDAWATPDGGLWLELDWGEVAADAKGRNTCVFASEGGIVTSPRASDDRLEGAPVARDACAGGHELFVPMAGRWKGHSASSPPLLARLAPASGDEADGDVWARASVIGPRAQIHALVGEGVLYAIAAAEDPEKAERARFEAFAVDRTSGVVHWRTEHDWVSTKPHLGEEARLARRPNGELLFQSLDGEGLPCTPLLCARSDGHMGEVLLGARGGYVLDAALGDFVLAHRENKDGHVEVGGFAIDNEGRILGRRASAKWTIDAGNLGGSATVYAGAGAVVARGARRVCAVTL